jgi:phosphoglycolate phosphatase-like HAD superfamily hydrolase
VEAAFVHTSVRFSGKDIVIIGDTPRDVECGRPLGVRTVAVATGPYTLDQLRETGPDFLFVDFTDTEKVVDALLKPM